MMSRKANYASTLDSTNLQVYKSKLNYCGGIDPYLIKRETCDTDWKFFPNIQHGDIVNYLVFSTCSITLNQMKAYKATEAHNFFTSGFVKPDILQKTVDSDRVLMLGEVNHSQSLRAKLLQVWILAKRDGEIISANCTCMAGLGGACSHVGALLFAIETGVRLAWEKSCTSEINTWLPTHSKNAPYMPIKDLDFSSADKKHRRLEEGSLQRNVQNEKKKKCLLITDEAINNLFSNIAATSVDAAILRVVSPYCDKYATQTLPEPFWKKFYKSENENMSWEYLLSLCRQIYESDIVISKKEAILLEKMTKNQSHSKLWFDHRAGRITASSMKATCSTELSKPCISLIKRICYPEENSFSSVPTDWGKKNESRALDQYLEKMKTEHTNFVVQKCGLNINPDFPFIGATPDAIISCDCCGQGVCEIKCPYTFKDNTLNEILDSKSKNLPLVLDDLFNINLSMTHEHYFQVQTQMFVTNAGYGDFVLWTEKTIYVERIQPNILFWEDILEKSRNFFLYVILPELTGKWYSRRSV